MNPIELRLAATATASRRSGRPAAGVRFSLRCAAGLVVLLLAGCSVGGGEPRTDRQSIDVAGPARLEIEMAAGDLVVSGGAAQFMEAEFTYNADGLKPSVERRESGGLTLVEVTQPDAGLTFGDASSSWNLRVKDGAPVEIVANVGAGETKMTLGSLDLRSVEVALGAGEVSVDLRGSPKASYSVRISGGVGEAQVYLPDGVGISATATGGLGSIDVQGLEQRGERWIRPGQESNPVKLTVDVSGGVGEIRLIAR
jgi:hypothetical protein